MLYSRKPWYAMLSYVCTTCEYSVIFSITAGNSYISFYVAVSRLSRGDWSSYVPLALLWLSYVLHINICVHDDVIKWKHFPRYWPFLWVIHRSPETSQHKGHWRGALMFSLICACINGWVNNREAGDLRRSHAYYNVIVTVYRSRTSGEHRRKRNYSPMELSIC